MDLVLVVRVVQHRVEVQVVDLGDRGDVARDRLRDLDVVLALELEQVRDLEGLLAVVDEQLRVLLHRALVDAEDAELADEGIVDDLEDVGDDVRRRIGRGFDRRGVVARAFDERRRIALRPDAGTGCPATSSSSRHADAAARGDEAHGHEVAFAQALFERVVQFLARQAVFAEVEVMVHHRFVDLDHLVDDLLVPVGDGAEVGIAFGDAAAVTEAVDHARAAVGGQVEREALRGRRFRAVRSSTRARRRRRGRSC